MIKHGWNESDLNLDDREEGDGITEPKIDLGQYDEDDDATLPWLPPTDRRAPARH